MNNARRNRINKIISQLTTLKIELEDIQSEEQDAFDAMPENLQLSEKGQASEDAIQMLSDSLDSFEDAISNLEEVVAK